MIRFMSRLFKAQRGASAVEYGLICGLIVVAMMVGIRSTAKGTGSLWQNVSDRVSTVMN